MPCRMNKCTVKSMAVLLRVLLVLTFLLISTEKAYTRSLDYLAPGQSIRDGETIVSADESFELGFFSPGSSNNRYLGIWYKRISEGLVVWVANREAPLTDRLGLVNVASQGTITLLNSTEYAVWSSNVSRPAKNPVVQLLDSGNLVVRDGDDTNPDNSLWQSFDYPSETLLPGAKWGKNLMTGLDRYISSWKSADDPARGEFRFGLDVRGYHQMVITKGTEILYRTGTWNGLRWSGVPELKPNSIYTYNFVSNAEEAYYRYDLVSSLVPSRLVMNPTGIPQCFSWINRSNVWAPFSSVQIDQCDYYGLCGANGNCNINDQPVCTCLEGFIPKSPNSWIMQTWSDGCVRRTKLDSGSDGFLQHKGVKLPDLSDSWVNTRMNLKECEDLCSKNCSCIAFANSDIRGRGSGCIQWFGDLIDLKELPEGGQDLYRRVAFSDQGILERGRTSSKKKPVAMIVAIVAAAISIGGVLVIMWMLYWRRNKPRQLASIENSEAIHDMNYEDEGRTGDMELPTFDFSTIANATDYFPFNKKLGEGGFGSVYKGILQDGQEIAVKRLSRYSGQGLIEFKNEVILISKLQHRNLVKLLGCCIEGEEKMLIYEYMPNKSLDCFIFGQESGHLLDWRMRINIIGGVARGLLYLHQDSRLRIIHRDLKASNVLLDNSMNPKISDFGMARSFGANQIEANTSRIVGTYGYMSPEYAVDGLFSIKSDVYSYGVLVLEIVSGRKNRGFNHPDHCHNLLGHAWRLWNEGRTSELIAELAGKSGFLSEILRCIHVGLLCVQQRPENRPSMSSVVVMLSSEILLPAPKKPGFFTERNIPEKESSSSSQKSYSKTEISFTSMEPR